ncbi:MAG: hypothetical protein G01um101413_813 [Parcubacteria group bacterium Gr01-1014_13]|nr:MAG: hypothetical protein G01um101413_813 [Parcubacteria group bacterium Gr01-1014_13]
MFKPQKFYAALIVSRKPINLGDLPQDHSVTHLVNEEFELKSNGRGGWMTEKSVPHHYDSYKGSKEQLRGSGQSISLAIVDWFASLCSYVPYLSLERKRKLEQEKEDKVPTDE